jgi:hypothetical protein
MMAMFAQRDRTHERYREPAAASATAVVAVQTKLRVGAVDDPLEAEADAMADRVMRMPQLPLVQRTCAACEDENERSVQRSPAPATSFAAATPSAGGEVPMSVASRLQNSQTGGASLEPAVQSFMESRFAADLSAVKVHTDDDAVQMNEALGAEAFTAGQHIYFDRGRYDPNSRSGNHLLAHELAHTLQQGYARASPRPQRKVRVDKPKGLIDNPTGKGLVQTNAVTVESYLRVLCSEGAVSVDKGTGAVSMKKGFCPTFLPGGTAGPRQAAPSDRSKEPVGCECLCQMVDSATDCVIVVDDNDWPHTIGETVTTPSPNSPKLWGAATAGGKTLDIDPWLVLGHEFCGHAWLAENKLRDENATRGEGGHQETVERENELRKEHGIELRGGFKDPFCGESYWRSKSAPGKVEWSRYLSICEAWRNKTYGGKYKISDKIP